MQSEPPATGLAAFWRWTSPTFRTFGPPPSNMATETKRPTPGGRPPVEAIAHAGVAAEAPGVAKPPPERLEVERGGFAIEQHSVMCHNAYSCTAVQLYYRQNAAMGRMA